MCYSLGSPLCVGYLRRLAPSLDIQRWLYPKTLPGSKRAGERRLAHCRASFQSPNREVRIFPRESHFPQSSHHWNSVRIHCSDFTATTIPWPCQGLKQGLSVTETPHYCSSSLFPRQYLTLSILIDGSLVPKNRRLTRKNRTKQNRCTSSVGKHPATAADSMHVGHGCNRRATR
jgi:hypothetical protein